MQEENPLLTQTLPEKMERLEQELDEMVAKLYGVELTSSQGGAYRWVHFGIK
ncbi:MAG: hypothetical protein AB1345_12705 [Chloroflexota bacterium]